MTAHPKQQLKSPEEMPGNYGLPFLGEAVEILTTDELYLWRNFQRYGTVFKTRLLGRKIAVLISPDANQLILRERADHLSSRLGWGLLEPLFGTGMLLQDGEEHRFTRRLMYPAFHGQAISSYFDTIQSIVQDFFKSWAKQHTILLSSEFRKLTLTIASRLFLGAQTAQEVEQTAQWFIELLNGRQALLRLNIPFTRFARAQQARYKLQNFLRTIIAERLHNRQVREDKDVLDMLLAVEDEDGNRLSESEILDQVLFILLAAHETTTTVLSWLMFELGSHPDCLDNLRSEQAEVLRGNPLHLSHLNKLPYLTYVLKEAERLYPPLFIIPRGVIKDIEYAGYRIPSGWYVTISPMLTHRLPELYAEPDKFDPDRFAPPREEDKKHPFALVGFGSGPHRCLGFEFAQMEMKIVFSTLIRHYDWTVTPERSTLVPIHQPSKVQNRLRAHIVPIC